MRFFCLLLLLLFSISSFACPTYTERINPYATGTSCAEIQNPLVVLLVRRAFMSYVKRYTKKHIRNRIARAGANTLAGRSFDYAVEQTAKNLDASEIGHLQRQWRYTTVDVDHAHDCRMCRSICDRVEQEFTYQMNQGASNSRGRSNKSLSRRSSNYFRGTKIFGYAVVARPDDPDIARHYEEGTSDFGYTVGLEQSFGWVGFDFAYERFVSNNDNATNKEIKENAYRAGIHLGMPLLRTVYPHGGGGYRYGRLTFSDTVPERMENSGFYLYGGLDVRLNDHLQIGLRYLETFEMDLFTQNSYQAGLKIRF